MSFSNTSNSENRIEDLKNFTPTYIISFYALAEGLIVIFNNNLLAQWISMVGVWLLSLILIIKVEYYDKNAPIKSRVIFTSIITILYGIGSFAKYIITQYYLSLFGILSAILLFIGPYFIRTVKYEDYIVGQQNVTLPNGNTISENIYHTCDPNSLAKIGSNSNAHRYAYITRVYFSNNLFNNFTKTVNFDNNSSTYYQYIVNPNGNHGQMGCFYGGKDIWILDFWYDRNQTVIYMCLGEIGKKLPYHEQLTLKEFNIN